MLEAIRYYGIVPFFRCGIPGWSIEEMTPAECWFMSSHQLGPWDWKIDVIQSGEVAYGKYLRRKAGFATAEYYGHLLNWRRSQEKYRMVAGLKTVDDRLNALMAKVALDAIKEFGSLESAELRQLLEERIPAQERKSVGGHMEKYLLPKIKKTALDFTLQYLEMGCYVLTGDFQRVYRGPNCEYSGWQRASLTTPEALFGTQAQDSQNGGTQNNEPFWARFIDESASGSDNNSFIPDCTPQESYRIITERITSFFPGCEKELAKLLL